MMSVKLEVKGIRTGPSREWGPSGSYECSLYVDGKRAAIVFEPGDGGPLGWDWLGGSNRSGRDCPLKAKFDAYVASLPPVICDNVPLNSDGTKFSYQADGDSVVAKLVSLAEDNKWLRRQCRNKTLFRLVGDEDTPHRTEWKTIAHKFDKRVKEFLETKYGNTLSVIANETL